MKKTLLFSLLVAGMLTLASCGNAPKERSLQVNVHEGTIYYDYKL